MPIINMKDGRREEPKNAKCSVRMLAAKRLIQPIHCLSSN